MRQIVLMTILIAGLTVSYGFADMGGHMGSGQGNMDKDQGHMKGMLQGHELTGGIMHQMGQMSRLMQQMREMIAEKSDAESMSKMSGLMQEMSEHIEEMSKIMKKGNASEKEMQEMEEHNLRMQKSYDMMRW